MLSKKEIKYIQSSGHKKTRDEEGIFIAEGTKIIQEILTEYPQQLIKLYAAASFYEAAGLKPDGEQFIEVSETELERISQLQTPQQAVALMRKPQPASVTETVMNGLSPWMPSVILAIWARSSGWQIGSALTILYALRIV